jgi:hypothetical protein
MLLGKYVENDIDFESLADDINPSTGWGKERLVNYFKSCIDDVELLKKRRNVILKLRQHLRKNPTTKETVERLLARVKEIEIELEKEAELKDERVEEYYKQILWERDSWFSFLNNSSAYLETANVWKVWILPALTILIPALIIIMPFLIIRLTSQQDMTVTEYWKILQHILKQNGGSGNMLSGMLVPPWMNQKQGMQEWIQWGISIFMFGSSVTQQVTLARHLHTITLDMRNRGSLTRELQDIYDELSGIVTPVVQKYMELPENPSVPNGSSLQVFGFCWNKPDVFKGLKTNVGILDVMFTCAMLKKVGAPTYAILPESSKPVLFLQDFYHPHLKTNAITNTIDINHKDTSGSIHSLVTGPNRGGKSTALKAILVNVILAQSLGICFARRMVITPFKQIHTALSPSDTLGRLSLFEAEIEFAKEILSHLENKELGRSLLVMDEIFHSTNAVDGEEATKIFLDRLYDMSSSHISIISTHYVNLPESYAEKKQVLPLCLEAKKVEGKEELEYTYKITKGINRLSSVREILKERGLL